jgi:hypothetical protein
MLHDCILARWVVPYKPWLSGEYLLSYTSFFQKVYYSLQPILLFTNMDVSTTKMCLDTSILAKSYKDADLLLLAD